METPPAAASAVPSGDGNATDELITIAGGVEIEVEHQDGTREKVRVRQVPVSKIQQFALSVSLGNMADELELYCDKSLPSKPGETRWADTLTLNSVMAVGEKGREINIPFFKAWSKHQVEWRKSFGQATTAQQSDQSVNQSPSPTSAPQ